MTWKDIPLKNNPFGQVGTLKKIGVKEGYYGVYVQPGSSKDRRYSSYPYWRLYVDVPETSVSLYNDRAYILITPSYPALKTFLRDVLIHEYRTDISRNRNSDFKVKQPWLKNLVWDELIGEAKAQMEIDAYNVPEIYRKCGIMKGDIL